MTRMTRKRVAILISGRGSNMAALIEAAKAPDYPAGIVLVVSNRPDALGLAHAREAGIATALIATPLLAYLDLANIAMLFLLVVVLVAVRFGRGPSVMATCVSVACFDFFFVPPRFTFAVSDFQYLITFVVMLVARRFSSNIRLSKRY